MKIIKKILLVLLLFFFFYEIKLKGVPSFFSSRKIEFICMLIMFFLKDGSRKITIFKNLDKYAIFNYKRYCFCMICIWLYSICLAIANNRMSENYVDAKSLTFFLLYSVIIPFLIWSIFDNAEDFCVIVSIIGVIQATLVYVISISPALRMFLDSFLELEKNRTFSAMLKNKVFGVGAFGASGSVIMFLSIYALGYLIIKEKNEIINFVLMLYILLATVMVARTGFFFGCLFMFILLGKRIRLKLATKKLVRIVIALLVCFIVPLTVLSSEPMAEDISKRIDVIVAHLDSNAIFSQSKPSFLSDMLAMSSPELTLEWIVGSGHSRGISSSGRNIQNDMGYVQRMYSLGYVVAFMFYFLVFVTFYNVSRKISETEVKKYYRFLLLCLFVLEFKEQFLYYYIFPAFLLVFGMLIIKQQRSIQLRTLCDCQDGG